MTKAGRSDFCALKKAWEVGFKERLDEYPIKPSHHAYETAAKALLKPSGKKLLRNLEIYFEPQLSFPLASSSYTLFKDLASEDLASKDLAPEELLDKLVVLLRAGDEIPIIKFQNIYKYGIDDMDKLAEPLKDCDLCDLKTYPLQIHQRKRLVDFIPHLVWFIDYLDSIAEREQLSPEEKQFHESAQNEILHDGFVMYFRV